MNKFNPEKHWHHPQRTFGERMSDIITHRAGSWTFILTLISILILWITINVMAWEYRWDPYPFILFNLFLSTLAALQAPIILMSQNRMTAHDRWKAEQDYLVNKKAEEEIQALRKEIKKLRKK